MLKLLEEAESIYIRDIRIAMNNIQIDDGIYFVIKSSNTGPKNLLWLGLDLETAANDVGTTDSSIVIDVTSIYLDVNPKIIRWSLGAYYDIPALSAFLIKVEAGIANTRKLGHKTSITKQGAMWRGKKEL